jgi:tetratricopeptide (TPR) repeat protein
MKINTCQDWLKNISGFMEIKYLSFALAILVLPIVSYSNRKIDSLQKTAEASKGIEKFKALKALTKAFQQQDPNKAYETAVVELKVASLLKRRDLAAEAMNDMAIPLLMMQKNREAISLLSESVRIYDSISNPKGLAYAMTNLGIAWSQNGSFEKALESYQKSIPFFQSVSDDFNLAKVHMSMGLVYEELNKHQEALETTLKSKELFEKAGDQKMLADINVNLGISLRSLGKYQESIECLNSALEYYNSTQNRFGLAIASTNLANTYQAARDFSTAEKWYNKSLPLIQSINNIWAEASLRYNLAEMRIMQRQWEKALQELEHANRLNKNSDNPKLAVDINYAFYLVYDTLKHDRLALNYFKKYSAINDSLSSEKRARIIEELTIGFETRQKAAEIEILKENVRDAKWRQILLVITIIVLILIGGLILAFLSQKRKNLRLMKEQAEQEKKIKETELEAALTKHKLQEEENENLFIQIQLKEQDLVYQTLQRLELSQVNRSVVEKMQPFQYKLINKKDQSDFQVALSEIARESEREPMADFEIMFKQLHKGFYDNLLVKCSNFSKTELQICALLRSNLSSKDIARLLNLSASSVDMSRHRIRQKLELDQKQSLTSYLMTL